MTDRLEPIRGVMAPILTPFNADLTIAHDLFADHAHHLIKSGCAGLAPFGTTGEALSLGIEERIVALERLLDRGIDAKQLIPGTGLTNLPDTIRLTRHAVDRGCAGAMVLPPFYFKNVPDEGLFTYFASLIERVASDALRLYLYHIPPVAQVGFSIELIRRHQRQFRRLGQHTKAADRGARAPCVSRLRAAIVRGPLARRSGLYYGHRKHQCSRHRRDHLAASKRQDGRGQTAARGRQEAQVEDSGIWADTGAEVPALHVVG